MANTAKGRILAKGEDRKRIPPQDELRRILDYNPDTGELSWKQRPREDFISDVHFRSWHNASLGKPIGLGKYRPDGVKRYKRISINGERYQAHRVIWTLMNGEIPDGMWIDHADQDRWNNRISNLRLVDASQSVWNRGKQKSRTDLPRGVGRIRYKGVTTGFTAKVATHGKPIYLGYFKTAEEAGKAYEKAVKEIHGEFACLE